MNEPIRATERIAADVKCPKCDSVFDVYNAKHVGQVNAYKGVIAGGKAECQDCKHQFEYEV